MDLGMYHLSVKKVSRKQGRSAVGAAAYRSGEKLYDDYYGLVHDYTRKTGIIHTEILLPTNAPREFLDRNTLWNAVEVAEKRVDSRTAREIEIALPNELSLDKQIELVRGYVVDNFVSQGMCADVAIHDGKRNAAHKNTYNPHAHILLTTRPVGREGFYAKKNRDWDNRENVSLWREQWAKAQNREFERNGIDKRVSHESYASLGIDREPTKHLGPSVAALQRRNIPTDRSNENLEIIARNKEREEQKHREYERSQNRDREQSYELSH